MKPPIIALAAALILAACAAPPATPPTAAPSLPATAAPPAPTVPAPAPSAAATPPPATPAAGPLLPAPLYVLELGQIARIERDGVTRAVLTAEQVQIDGVRPIAEFAAAPAGGLAYIVGDLEADRLVVADARGQGPRTLYAEPGHELSDPLFAPDGGSVVFRLLNNREPPDIPAGIYSIPLAGGAPALLRADDPVDDPVNPARAVSGYVPVAFSPDGARLLVEVQSSFYEDCTLGVMPAAGGEVARVALPEGQSVFCGEQAWTADGTGVLFLAGPPDGPDAGPGLWRADAATAAAAPLLPAGFARAPAGLPAGAVRFFLVRPERDSAGVAVGATFAPAGLDAGAAAPAELGPPFADLLGEALWAPDGAGAAVEVSSADERSILRWLPAGGDPVELPSSGDGISGMAWGVE